MAESAFGTFPSIRCNLPDIADRGWIHETNDRIVLPHAKHIVAHSFSLLLQESLVRLRLTDELSGIQANKVPS